MGISLGAAGIFRWVIRGWRHRRHKLFDVQHVVQVSIRRRGAVQGHRTGARRGQLGVGAEKEGKYREIQFYNMINNPTYSEVRPVLVNRQSGDRIEYFYGDIGRQELTA